MRALDCPYCCPSPGILYAWCKAAGCVVSAGQGGGKVWGATEQWGVSPLPYQRVGMLGELHAHAPGTSCRDLREFLVVLPKTSLFSLPKSTEIGSDPTGKSLHSARRSVPPYVVTVLRTVGLSPGVVGGCETGAALAEARWKHSPGLVHSCKASRSTRLGCSPPWSKPQRSSQKQR